MRTDLSWRQMIQDAKQAMLVMLPLMPDRPVPVVKAWAGMNGRKSRGAGVQALEESHDLFGHTRDYPTPKTSTRLRAHCTTAMGHLSEVISQTKSLALTTAQRDHVREARDIANDLAGDRYMHRPGVSMMREVRAYLSSVLQGKNTGVNPGIEGGDANPGTQGSNPGMTIMRPWPVCLHEGAHATAAVILGHQLVSVSVDAGPCCKAHLMSDAKKTPLTLLSDLAYFALGEVAQRQAGEPIHPGEDVTDDPGVGVRLLRDLSRYQTPGPLTPTPDVRTYWSVVDAVDKLVHHTPMMDSIKVVARCLKGAGTLDGKDVSTAVRLHLDPERLGADFRVRLIHNIGVDLLHVPEGMF